MDVDDIAVDGRTNMILMDNNKRPESMERITTRPLIKTAM